jgi:uridine kinase
LNDENKFNNLVSAISVALSDPSRQVGNSTLVTIDGPAGSGKTTLAKKLSDHFKGLDISNLVIHADDLYNGWDDALGESLTKTLADSVLPGIASNHAYFLPRFDWILNEYSHPFYELPARLVFVEGVGTGQRVMRAPTAISIWIEVSDEIGLIRVLNRDGAGVRKQMHNFQISQRAHFAAEKTKESADFFFDGAP